MQTIIKRVNSITRGWGNYFRGGVRNVPERLDQWIRMRLRSILRKRDKRTGRGRGRDHNRYPNAWSVRDKIKERKPSRYCVLQAAVAVDSSAKPGLPGIPFPAYATPCRRSRNHHAGRSPTRKAGSRARHALTNTRRPASAAGIRWPHGMTSWWARRVRITIAM